MQMDTLEYNNPISFAKIGRLLKILNLSKDCKVLDVGCGQGELLRQVVRLYNCSAVGVDINEEEINAAKKASKSLHIDWHCQSIREMDLSSQGFSVGFCIGSTHAFGEENGYKKTLAAFQELITQEGLVIIGEGYWKKEPDPEYLKETGIKSASLKKHFENVELAEEMGFTPLYITRSSESEWDHFESCFWLKAEEKLRNDPHNPDLQKKTNHWRKWRRAYLRWGKDTMGFGLYVFRK